MDNGSIGKRIWQYVLPILVLAGALYGAQRLIASRPEAQRRKQPERVTSVRVVAPVLTTFTPEIEAMGQAQPAQHVVLRAEVGGRVTMLHPEWEAGGRFRKGELLVALEREDYEAALAEAQSRLAQANLQLDLDIQRQQAAEDELLQSGETLPEGAGRRIALREPQVKAARSAVAAAQAAVGRAQRNLDRTQLHAPFDAVLLAKGVDVGSVVSPQAMVAELAAIHRFHLEAAFPPGQLRWLPETTANGRFAGEPPVAVHVHTGGGTFTREGKMIRVLGDVDGNMARVLVEIPDPLHDDGDMQPLLLGMYGRCMLPGRELQDVLLIPRRALHDDKEVWVAGEGDRLEKRMPELLLTRDDVVVVGSGLPRDARIIVSPLVAAVEGMPLLVEEGEALNE